MSTVHEYEITRLPLNTQVLVRLRPEIDKTATRSRLPFTSLALLAVAVVITIWFAVEGWWLIIIVPLLGVFYNGVMAATYRYENEHLIASSEYLKKSKPRLRRTAAEVPSKVLHRSLAPLNELPDIPGHRMLPVREDERLVIELVGNFRHRVLEADLGPTADINANPDTAECAEEIIQGFQDLASFYAATDAFTRPPRLPESQDRMVIEPLDAKHYLADGQTVKSPGFEQISMDTAIACWEPWRRRSVALHREQRLEQQRRDQWLEEAKQDTIDRLQGQADDQLVARRKAHLERIAEES